MHIQGRAVVRAPGRHGEMRLCPTAPASPCVLTVRQTHPHPLTPAHTHLEAHEQRLAAGAVGEGRAGARRARHVQPHHAVLAHVENVHIAARIHGSQVVSI